MNSSLPKLTSMHRHKAALERVTFHWAQAVCGLLVALSTGDEHQKLKQGRQQRWVIKGFILTTRRRLQPAWHPFSPPISAPLSWAVPGTCQHLPFLCFAFSNAEKAPPAAQKYRAVNIPGATLTQ